MRRTLLILLLFLAGCSAESWQDRISTPEERAMALKAATAMQAGDYEAFDVIIDPPLRDFVTPEAMKKKIQPMVPKGPIVLKSIGVRSQADGQGTIWIKSFNYEVGSGDRWAVVQITLRHSPWDQVVAGYRVWQTDRSPTAMSFSLTGAGAIQYLWLVAMTLVVALSLIGLVQVLRTRGLKLKGVWAIGCLVSFVNFQLNWATGEWGIWPISFSVLGAGFFQPDPFGPPILQFAIPVVAIVFLILRAGGRFESATEIELDVF